MKQFIALALILFFMLHLSPESKGQKIPVYEGFNTFEPVLNQQDDTTYVINFWATWCKPCIKEIPYFQQAHKDYAGSKVKIMLISLDFGPSAKKQVQKFIEARNISSRVAILDDPKSNSWIDKVSANWSGSIPATLIYNNNQRNFYEKEFTREELYTAIDKHMEK